ncbi:MAG: AAA family ATPase [bacterium]
MKINFKRKQNIEGELEPKRVLVIYGPRRVGKTTMLETYLKGVSEKKVYYETGDDARLHEIFKPEYKKEIIDFANPYDIIALDEAQYIPSIGMGAKMMIDAFPEKNIILTGSSSFDLSNKIGEPLTGRHFTLTLLPLSQREIEMSKAELKWNLEDFLIYGSYPEVLNEPDTHRKIKILNELLGFKKLHEEFLAINFAPSDGSTERAMCKILLVVYSGILEIFLYSHKSIRNNLKTKRMKCDLNNYTTSLKHKYSNAVFFITIFNYFRNLRNSIHINYFLKGKSYLFYKLSVARGYYYFLIIVLYFFIKNKTSNSFVWGSDVLEEFPFNMYDNFIDS